MGTVMINAGAEWAKSAAVTLTLTATDASMPIQMCISNTRTCTAWTTFAAAMRWKLSSGRGTKAVGAWFRDTRGDTATSPMRDTILLDTTAPTNGKVTAEQGDGSLSLSWDGFSDGTGSGIVTYKAVYQKGGVAPSSCNAGTVAPVADDATTLDFTGPDNGAVYSFRICAIDAVGRMSAGATVSAKQVPELVPPTGTVTINAAAAATKSTAAKLTLALDIPEVGAMMCVSNGGTCSAWTAFAVTKN